MTQVTCHSTGAVDSKALSAPVIQAGVAADIPRAVLRSVHIEVLDGCNLHCDYCYIGEERNHGDRRFLSVDSLRSMLITLRHDGVAECVFLGGEPLLHPGLPEMVTSAFETGFRSVGLVTNGTIFRDEVAAALGSRGWVDITIRAFDADVWKILTRSRIPLDRVFAVARRYMDADIPVGFEIDVTPEMADHIEQGLSRIIARFPGARSIRLHRIAPTGDAACRSDPRLASSEWNRILRAVQRLVTATGVQIFLEDGLPLCLVEHDLWPFVVPCECGVSFATIAVDGGMRDCPCRPLGGSHSRDDSQQWAVSAPQPSPPQHSECSRCVLASVCRSGCRASAAFTAHDQFTAAFKAFQHVSDAEAASLRLLPNGVYDQRLL